MKNILVLALLLISCHVPAQMLHPSPLKGKVKSNKIVRLYADSLNRKPLVIEQTEFDKNGQVTIAVHYHDGAQKQEKHILKDSTITSYECECPNIDDLIKNFQIKSKPDLDKMPKRYTATPPTSFVTIKTLDKKGNIILAKRYSAKGYLNNETRSTYSSFNKLLERNEYNTDLHYSEFNKYGNKGNLLEHTTVNSSNVYTPKKVENKRTVSYDAYGNLTDSKWYVNGNLYIHSKYSIKKIQDKVQFIYTNQIDGSTAIEKEIIYKNGKEIMNKEFEEGKVSKTTETEYYATGFIKSQSIHNAEHQLIQKTLFENDKNNNWLEMKIYQKTIQMGWDNSKKITYELSVYKQETEYY